MRSFHEDYAWQRQFLPAMKRILGESLFVEASFEEDTTHNTDLIVLRQGELRVACRVRRPEELWKYHDRADQITMRVSRPNGVDTEFQKVMHGWGDLFFYGYASACRAGEFACWVLGDLRQFRRWFIRQLYQGRLPRQLPGMLQRNKDGSSDFVAYLIADMDPKVVVARQRPTEEPPPRRAAVVPPARER